MPETDVEKLAPSVVVVGPPNSGKTTFLHQLDEYLQHHGSRPLVHVVKGSPDATGRYLYYAPELRERVSKQLKGQWDPLHTVETICLWTLNARRNLEMVLLDFGGRHSAVNPAILRCCTHYMVVARPFNDPAQEQAEGKQSWIRACEDQGLRAVAHIESQVQSGPAQVIKNDPSEPLQATYRPDAAKPGDPTNQAVIEAVGKRVLELCLNRGVPPYLDLRLDRRWEINDLRGLAGLIDRLKSCVCETGRLRLGGRAPIWAYLAAMHRALDCNPSARIEVFEPKWPGGFIQIPEIFAERPGETWASCLAAALASLGIVVYQKSPGKTWASCLAAAWGSSPDLGRTLELRTLTPDRMLPQALALLLNEIPRPSGEVPQGCGVTVNGPGPIWAHLTYSRWLRSKGVSPIAVYDTQYHRVQVHPPVTTFA